MVETLDPDTGETISVPRELRPVAGYDLVFSAPKSVSLLHALGDPATRRHAHEAHEVAWRAALDYLEREACVVRSGKAGVVREHARGVVAAAFTHRTSRAQDPQLHTHVVLANVGLGSDGRWRALDGQALLGPYALTAGYLYQAELRHQLAHRLGVRWTPITNGLAEIDGIPTAVLEAFSTRRLAVLGRMAETGGTTRREAQIAAHETRDRKEPIDLPRLRRAWGERAADLGLTPDELAQLISTPRRPTPIAADAVVRELVGPLGLTATATRFTAPDAIRAICQRAPDGLPAHAAEQLARDVLQADGVQRLTDAAIPGRPDHWTTRELERHEQRIIAVVDRDQHAGPTAPHGALASALATADLSAEQATMVTTGATSGARIVCVVGAAGSGKTTAARALATTLATSGIPVLGAAPTGTAARQLEAGAGIPSSTIHRLLRDADTDGGLPRRCVVIVDEAAMVETRILAPLLEAIEQADGRAVLIGDPAQLPSVGAGGMFSHLIERCTTVQLLETHRQHDPTERAALAAIRDGHGRDYVAWAIANDRLVTSPDPIAARARLLADWWRAARDDPAGNVMIAYRRRDTAELNRIARQIARHEQRLHGPDIRIGPRSYAVGDRIVCRRNDPASGVVNGTRGSITAIDTVTHAITIALDEGGAAALPGRYAERGHLHHGYAITGHTSQGATFDRAFALLPPDGALKEWAYVALSRARHRTRVHSSARATPQAVSDSRVDMTALGLERSAVDR